MKATSTGRHGLNQSTNCRPTISLCPYVVLIGAVVGVFHPFTGSQAQEVCDPAFVSEPTLGPSGIELVSAAGECIVSPYVYREYLRRRNLKNEAVQTPTPRTETRPVDRNQGELTTERMSPSTDTTILQASLEDRVAHFLDPTRNIPSELIHTHHGYASDFAAVMGKGHDLGQSVNQLEQAARTGKPRAQVLLGDLYLHGVYRGQDPDIALRWYISAAARNSDAAERAGDLYASKREIDQDLNLAKHYYQLAVDGGSLRALVKLGDLLRSEARTSEGFAGAFQRYHEAAGNAEPLGNVRMAEMLLAGEGVDRDATRAYELFRKAADAGNVEGMNGAGELLYSGNGVTMDAVEAVRLWGEAGSQGHAPAIRNYAIAKWDGQGIEKDRPGSIRLLWHAYDLGDQEAGEKAEYFVWRHCEGQTEGSCFSVPVFYATTREKFRTADGVLSYSSKTIESRNVHFGVSWWDVPDDRRDEFRRESRFRKIHSQNLFGKKPYKSEFRMDHNSSIHESIFF